MRDEATKTIAAGDKNCALNGDCRSQRMHGDMSVPTSQCKEASLHTPKIQLRLEKSQK